jgi:hypothetical protein
LVDLFNSPHINPIRVWKFGHKSSGRIHLSTE